MSSLGAAGGPLDGIPLLRSQMALEKLAAASHDALRFFRAGEYDAAGTELIRARKAIRVLDEIRREQRVAAREAEQRLAAQEERPS